MNGQSIMLKAVYEQLEDCKDAEQEIIDARKSITFANVLGGVGGFFIGWPLGQAVSGKEPNVTMAIVGVALTFLSAPLRGGGFFDAGEVGSYQDFILRGSKLVW